MKRFKVFVEKWFADMEEERTGKQLAYGACKKDWMFDYHPKKTRKGICIEL